ncbi:MAG: hypothetical protein KF901_33665 [Myxococcales bacterium]|nr:hypothetical protein [Myxococcales bacterium]
MRRWLPMMLVLVACGGDQVGLFADMQWQVRCPRDLAGCSRNGEPADVFAGASEPGVNISCLVQESGATRFIRFDVSQGGQRLAIDGLAVPVAGGPVQGTGCSVTVVDDSVTYNGRCGSSPVSVEQPCRVSAVNFITEPTGVGDEGEFGPELKLDLQCGGAAGSGVTSASDPMRFRRDVYRTREGTTPATIRLINCPGL